MKNNKTEIVIMVTLRPECEVELDRLKKEQFYKKTQNEMFRYLIACSLDALKTEKVSLDA